MFLMVATIIVIFIGWCAVMALIIGAGLVVKAIKGNSQKKRKTRRR